MCLILLCPSCQVVCFPTFHICLLDASSSDFPEQVSQPQEEAFGPMYPGPTQCQLLRLRQQTWSHSQTQRPQNHGPLSAGQGKLISLFSAQTCHNERDVNSMHSHWQWVACISCTMWSASVGLYMLQRAGVMSGRGVYGCPLSGSWLAVFCFWFFRSLRRGSAWWLQMFR